MHYLDVDLKDMCWSKLDYSRVSDMSKVVLYDKPLVLDTFDEKIEYDKKYKYYGKWYFNKGSSAIICATEQSTCLPTDIIEMSKVLIYNGDLVKSIFGDDAISIAIGLDMDELKEFRAR